MRDYPHMNDTNFPGLDNINVYKYRNTFDYNRWTPETKITMCRVPWCDDYEHVVKFDNDLKRDAYFSNLKNEPIKLQAMINALPDTSIKLPVPFDIAAQYNYIVVDFPIKTSSTNKIDFERNEGKRKWFYFLHDISYAGPNTTECVVSVDYWTTFINDIDITYVMLERGHAPMASINVNEYLYNPIENNTNLLAPDVNFGNCNRVASTDAYIFNGYDMYACICTSADLSATWQNYSLPAKDLETMQGVPAPNVFACRVTEINVLFKEINEQWPQFMQSVKCVFFATGELLNFSETWKFGSIDCWYITSQEKKIATLKLSTDLFNFEPEYKKITKLYTSPYSQLEFYDESGSKTIVNIEDCSGEINLNAKYSLIFPYINLNAHITGIGSVNIINVNFQNIESHSFKYGGKWAETLRIWNIPTFGIYQSASKHNEYDTNFTRAQSQTALQNTYESAINTADLTVTNTDVQVLANETMVEQSNQSSFDELIYANRGSAAQVSLAKGFNTETQAVEATAETQKAAVSATTGVVSQAVSGAITGAAAGGLYGAVGGLCVGAIGGVTGAISTGANAAISINLAASKVELTNNLMDTQRLASVQADHDRNDVVSLNVTNNAKTQNDAGLAVALNTSNNAKTNALLSKRTAESAINNQILQAATAAPFEFGTCANASTATTNPQGYFVNIVTQSNSAIAQAGDIFLRYGYALNRQWNFTNFNIMKHFTYWKCSEVWSVGGNNNMNHIAEDTIRSILMQGVTVWRNPNEIGKVSIYDN